MKIQLLAGVGGFPTGSVHRVLQVITHGGHTDDAHQYLIQGQVYVPESKARVVADETPGKPGDAELMGDAFTAAWLREENREMRRYIDKIERENVDLKNQLADLRHEIEMNGWLR